MAHWGIAMTLFQPLWPTRPGARCAPARLERTADGIAAGAADRARAAVRRDRPGILRRARRRRLLAAHPALGAGLGGAPSRAAGRRRGGRLLRARTPRDRTGKRRSRARTRDESARRSCSACTQANPDHPGAMHYLVHANDVPGRERELLEITRKYETAAPRNPHALHMPTHIYTRLGDWDGVIRGNLLAADAALEYPAGEHGEFVWDEFPHAIEYLVYAYLQQRRRGQGARPDSSAWPRRNGWSPASRRRFTSLPRARVTRSNARTGMTAASAPARQPANLDWDRFPWPEAIAVYARASARLASAGRQMRVPPASGLKPWRRKPRARARSSLRATSTCCASRSMRGRQQLEGRPEAAIERMQEAATLETSTPKHAVTPAPYVTRTRTAR